MKAAITLFALAIGIFCQINPAFAFAPEKPTLSINKDNALCAPFLSAWQNVFEQNGPVNEYALPLNNYFEPSQLVQFPEKAPPSLYGHAYFFQADLDADGINETLYIESNEVGWRYLGISLYLVKNFEELKKEFSVTIGDNIPYDIREKIIPKLDPQDTQKKKHFKKIYSYGPAEYVHFLKKSEALYSFSIPEPPAPQAASSTELVSISANGTETICKIDLLPAKNKYQAFIDKSDAYKTLQNIYGGIDKCMGTMGWTAKPLDYSLSNIFERPHVLFREQKHDLPDLDTARRLRYLSWGTSDPISWKSFEAIENAEHDFTQYMTEYYKKHFSFTKEKANKAAQLAWKYWLDSVIYARSPDRYKITAIVPPFTVEPGITTHDLVHQAFLALQENDPNFYARTEVLSDLLPALIYTASETENVSKIYGTIHARQKEIYPAYYKEILNKALLASIGNTEFLQLSMNNGANINAETNWFKKTPLMYAAQMNDAESIKFLITHGANVNAKTDSSKNGCYHLKQDYRTPLMYAAENGDEKTIRLLIDAGARLDDVDSNGNSAEWYLEKNTIVSNKEELKALLRP
ncbi:ankyrin repeat domain-containing protein [Micavibrio aeruginosavorus]|uniref:ankyrin repeat domain-containing protein n=1 Tax=Micavibrio aeruginosavorus TaxID=349221 RepID=UPI003F4A981F